MILKHHARGHFWCNPDIEVYLSNKKISHNWNIECFTSLDFGTKRAFNKNWKLERHYKSEWQMYNNN